MATNYKALYQQYRSAYQTLKSHRQSKYIRLVKMAEPLKPLLEKYKPAAVAEAQKQARRADRKKAI
jgi:hypothetical protein